MLGLGLNATRWASYSRLDLVCSRIEEAPEVPLPSLFEELVPLGQQNSRLLFHLALTQLFPSSQSFFAASSDKPSQNKRNGTSGMLYLACARIGT